MTVWPSISYPEWSATCDTLHAHTQVLGKLAAELAPPEPQLQHAALRLTARGWETAPLPTPDGNGAFVVALDLHRHETFVETTDGDRRVVPLVPNRAVGEVTRDLLKAIADVAGEAKIDPEPQEVAWTTPLDADTERATYDEQAVGTYFRMATRASQVLAAFRAPWRGRSTPVNAWWGSFDLAVNLFSGDPAKPPADDFIMRNAMDAQEVAVGWWPGDPKHGGAAFYAYAHPANPGFSEADLGVPGSRWDGDLGEYVLEWEDVVKADDPHARALDFARSAFAHACATCGWDPALAATAESKPPPVA
ncbi:MAG: hypothetical protein JST59_20170 [Actinobacteria bacterium]|nr:hypothetical protein [Actinomycetota bacterium]